MSEQQQEVVTEVEPKVEVEPAPAAPAVDVEPKVDPAPEPAAKAEPTAEEVAEQDAKEFESGFDGAPPPGPSKKAELTEEHVRSLIESGMTGFREEFGKVKDSLFGKIGETNRALQAMQKAPGTKLAKEAFKRVTEKFGEEFAEALAGDLSEAIPGTSLDEALTPRLDKFEHEQKFRSEQRMLLREHRDFYDQMKKPEFAPWLATLSPEDQKEWKTTIDADWLGDKMTEFKKHATLQVKKQDQQRKLTAALQPKGGPVTQAGLSDEAQFEAGFYGKR